MTSANVIIILIHNILYGLIYLPSLIGIPKLMTEQSNCKNMVRENPPNYSCIKFYTPFRNKQVYKDQPLRLWFANDKEQVTFGKDQNQYNIYIQDGKQIRSGVISRPDFVLLNLQEAVNRIRTKPNSLIKDYSIMTINAIDPEDIMINTCKNITDPHTHSNSNCVIS